MERQVTELQEQAYRKRHHEFEGLTTKETAKQMGISERTVERLLESLRAICPQLFPILTKHQFFIYDCYTGKGMTQEEIAETLNVTRENVTQILQRMQDNGMPGIDLKGMGKPMRYDNSMDAQIIRKW